MSMSDPIADLLTRLRNAIERRHAYVMVPSSKMKIGIVKVLEDEGYIEGFNLVDEGPRPMIRVRLRYAEGKQPVMTHIERISKPGRRVYTKRRDIPLVLSGMGLTILTTPKGVMSGRRARREQVGGEVLCHVW